MLSRPKPWQRGLFIVLGTIIGLWSAIPIAWMLITSFKPQQAIRTSDVVLTFTPTLENYQNLFFGGNRVGSFLVNSLLVSIISTFIALALGSLAGYGMAHWRSRHKKDVSFWILSTRMAPIAAVIVPLFVMFRLAGLVNTIPGLILACLTFNLPFAIWLMNAFFHQVPRSIEEAALVDGCSKMRAFWNVALPVTRPGLITTAVLCMVFAWNDYAFATSLGGPQSSTLPTAAGALVTQAGIDWGLLCALGIVIALPMLIAGLAVRRHLVTGLSLGAVTGE
jgi:multiple sugar transport system permease protein